MQFMRRDRAVTRTAFISEGCDILKWTVVLKQINAHFSEDIIMNEGQRNNITIETVAAVLGGSFLINFALLLLWFCIFLFLPEWFYRINENWFAISRHEFDLINYTGIAFLKIVNIVFFLCPYLSIKLWLRKNKLNN